MGPIPPGHLPSFLRLQLWPCVVKQQGTTGHRNLLVSSSSSPSHHWHTFLLFSFGEVLGLSCSYLLHRHVLIDVIFVLLGMHLGFKIVRIIRR